MAKILIVDGGFPKNENLILYNDASGTSLAPTEAERRKDCGSATHGTIIRSCILEK